MCHRLLTDSSLFSLLFRIDEELSEGVRGQGCPCGGVLHSARYRRKPRGIAGREDSCSHWRHSFCCDREGCRKRATPPSVRFLGRRVYIGVVVVLLTALHQGVDARRARHLRETIGVDRRTLGRWREWWLEDFVRSRFFKAERGRFLPPLEKGFLPLSLVRRFGAGVRDRLVSLLRFLSPITTTTWAGFAMDGN